MGCAREPHVTPNPKSVLDAERDRMNVARCGPAEQPHPSEFLAACIVQPQLVRDRLWKERVVGPGVHERDYGNPAVTLGDNNPQSGPVRNASHWVCLASYRNREGPIPSGNDHLGRFSRRTALPIRQA